MKYYRFRRILAGFPATTVDGGTFFVTTEPAPTIAPSPTVIPQRMVAFEPIEAPFLINVGVHVQSSAPWSCPSEPVACGNKSLVNMTPWPTKTSSSMVTPSQIKLWLEILHR